MAWKESVMTPKKIEEFKRAFSMGFTKAEACLYCEVNESTFYEYCRKWTKEAEAFVELIPTLQNMPKLKAKMNILEKINDKDDYNSRWYLEKTDKSFNPKQQIEQVQVNYNKDITEMSDEDLQNLIDWKDIEDSKE